MHLSRVFVADPCGLRRPHQAPDGFFDQRQNQENPRPKAKKPGEECGHNIGHSDPFYLWCRQNGRIDITTSATHVVTAYIGSDVVSDNMSRENK